MNPMMLKDCVLTIAWRKLLQMRVFIRPLAYHRGLRELLPGDS